MALKKEDLKKRSNAYMRAFQATARMLGKEHPLTKFMGALAWGRHDAERGPGRDTVTDVATEYGHLHGCERMLVSFCNYVGDVKARNVLLDDVRNHLHLGR